MNEPSRHPLAFRQIRSHLATRPTNRNRRWVLPSMSANPGLEVSVIASHTTGADAQCWVPRRGRISCWHISLCTLSLGRYADLEAVDLVGFSAGVFGRDASKAWLLPPAPVDDRDRNAPASPFTTHVRVFLDRRGRPMELGIDDVDKLLPWDALDLRSEVFRT